MSAPTTAEVREVLAKEEAEVAAEPETQTDYWAGAAYGAAGVYRHVALPIAEHRDALAAEVARLRARLECGASPYGVHRCVHCDSEVT